MEVLYKGEDHRFTGALYLDNTMQNPVVLTDYNVDILIYNDGDEFEIYLTDNPNSINNDIKISYVNANTIQTVVPSDVIERCSCGIIQFEIRLIDKKTGLKKIRKTVAYNLCDSRIKKR